MVVIPVLSVKLAADSGVAEDLKYDLLAADDADV
jgi:hypothetical protein